MRNLTFAALTLCSLNACATQPTKCPLGRITHISASGENAREMAYGMAARDALKDGFDKFTILNIQENPQQVKMTVHMLHAHENDESLIAIDAHSLMPDHTPVTTSAL